MYKNITAWDGITLPSHFKDFLGQEIHPGDYIIYSTVSGHSSTLSLAQVLEFVTHLADGREYKSYGRDGGLYFCVRVQPILDSGWKSRYSKDKVTGLPKKVVLQVFEKIVKVPAEFAGMAADV